MTRPTITAAERAARTRHPTAHHPPKGAARPPAPARYWLLAAIATVLALFGLVMVLSATSVKALHDVGNSWYFFNRQAMWTVLGFAAMAVFARIDHHLFRRLVPLLLLGSFGLLVLVLVPGIGTEVKGARAWFRAGPLSFQPSEVVKLTLLIYTADLLARRADRLREPGMTLVPPLLFLGGAALLVLAQGDLGSTIVVAAIVLSVLFIGGVPLTPLAGAATALAAVGTAAVMSASYRRDRILAFLDPMAHAGDLAYQNVQGLVGLATGGLTGVGLGAGRAKWGFLPEAHTDFIYAIIGEELGFVGCLMVVALFVAFGIVGVRVAGRATDRYGMLVAGGITAWIMVQALVNLGAVVGLLPITGLTLPFISFGGSSLVVTMAATGVLLNVARQGR